MSEQNNWGRSGDNRRGDRFLNGRGRGRRGGFRRERGQSSNVDQFRRTDRPPPGLRGKEIGLWYRDRYKRKEKVEDKIKPIPVNLDPACIDEIFKTLEHVKANPPDHLVKKYKSASFFTSNESKCKKFGPGVATSSFVVNNSASKYGHLEESIFKTSFLSSITGTIEEKLNRSLALNIALPKNQEIDDQLITDLKRKSLSNHYQEMMEFRKKLPSYAMKDKIINLVDSRQVIVISGETGCGKTTQVAQFILDNEIMKGCGSKCHIMCTQPRRISAISVAERVADERDEPVGEGGSVGYQIRLEKNLPRERGSILFCTTGILLQFMQSDPGLTRVSHIIIDEIHERDTLSDFSITLLKDILSKRHDLKLILMSATLNADRFSKYYNNCPMINIPGFTFPVTEYYLEDVLEMTKYKRDQKKQRRPDRKSKYKDNDKVYKDYIEPYVRNLRTTNKYSTSTVNALLDPEIEDIDLELICSLIHHICFVIRDPGAILIFLPGWDKISSLFKLLTESGSFPKSSFLLLPLHSMMPTVTQKSIFNRPPPGVRKIVIATNIAETSITIDDIVYVIDCGKIKMKNFDVENNISTLKPEWVSLANSRQRRGRAGRVKPGICFHLFSRAREMCLAEYPLPEMLRTRLEEVILQTKILQLGYVRPFLKKVLDPPDSAAIDLSLKMLVMLNALDGDDESLTPLGFHLAQLPLDPQSGKMILMGALFSCIDPIFSIAASLSYKDAFFIPLGQEYAVDKLKEELDMGRKSDHLLLAEAFSQWEIAENERWGHSFCQKNFLSRSILFLLKDMKKQFADHLYDAKFLDSRDHKSRAANLNSSNVGLIRAVICSGLFPNVAFITKVKTIRRTNKTIVSLLTAEDGRVAIHPKSVNERVGEFESRFLLYHVKLKSAKIYLHDTTMVHPLPLIFFGHSINQIEEEGRIIMELSTNIRFSMNSEVARLITELKIRLDWLLEKKISNPGMTDWSEDSDEGCILRAITKLITIEDRSIMEDCGDDDDDDDNGGNSSSYSDN